MTRARDIANFGDGIATADIGDGQVTAAKIGSLPEGSVLQVVSADLGGNASTTSTTFVASGLQVNITPASTDSKILVMVLGGSWYSASEPTFGTIYRNDTTNLGDTDDGLARSIINYHPHSMMVVDSPSTTSQVNYEAYFRTANGQGMYWSFSSYGRITMVAMEIAG